MGGAQSRATAPHWEESVEVVRTCDQDGGRPGTNWRGFVSWLAWEHLGIPPADLVQGAGEECLDLSAEAAKPNFENPTLNTNTL